MIQNLFRDKVNIVWIDYVNWVKVLNQTFELKKRIQFNSFSKI